MARNIKRYGYGPNRTSDTPAVMTRRVARANEPDATPPDTPLAHGERCMYYYRTNHGYTLTRRQERRLRRKSKVGAVAYAAGVRA